MEIPKDKCENCGHETPDLTIFYGLEMWCDMCIAAWNNPEVWGEKPELQSEFIR
jgi:hypothetical protein